MDLPQERYELTEQLQHRERRNLHRFAAGFLFAAAIAWYVLGWL